MGFGKEAGIRRGLNIKRENIKNIYEICRMVRSNWGLDILNSEMVGKKII